MWEELIFGICSLPSPVMQRERQQCPETTHLTKSWTRWKKGPFPLGALGCGTYLNRNKYWLSEWRGQAPFQLGGHLGAPGVTRSALVSKQPK